MMCCSDGGGGLKIYESQSLTTRINIYTYANARIARYAAAYPLSYSIKQRMEKEKREL